jgi:putative FmdB family regulatory protein
MGRDGPDQEDDVPTYAYACTACGHRFEVQQSFTDASLTECPECEGRLRKLFNSVGIVFKGSGFYRTDSRNGSSGAESGAGKDSGAKEPAKEPAAKESSAKESSARGSSSAPAKETANASSKKPATSAA